MALSAGVWVNVLGSLVLMALAAGVLMVRPRRRANVAFSAFCALWALAHILFNVAFQTESLALSAPLAYAASAAFVLTGVAILHVFRIFPQPLRPDERGALRTSLASAAVLGAAATATYVALPSRAQPFFETVGNALSGRLGFFSGFLFYSLLQSALILLALRFKATPPAEAALRRQYALMSAAILAYVSYVAGAGYIEPLAWWLGDVADLVVFGLYVAFLVALSLLWLRSASAPDGHLARNVAIFAFVPAIVGMMAGAYATRAGSIVGGHGIARTAAALILAYAILRFQLLGLDLKVKWTIKRGTLAAVVVAAFFVGSQLAEQTLSERFGVVGGAFAAGLLLFAISPLQRMAERVANAAMPGVSDTSEWRASRGEESYRMALRMALQDGSISREEERTLAMLATDLGIPAARAFELRDEVERAAAAA